MSTQLHQLLPAESDLAGRTKRILAEGITTFTKKTEHFTGHTRTLTMHDESRSNEDLTEVKALTTTVADKLAYIQDSVIPYYDAMVAKETTNQSARADVIVDGTKLLSDVPATALLAFESRLKDLRTVYEAIPTLAPGVDWIADNTKFNVWKDKNNKKSTKTEKSMQFKEVSPALGAHKAQVETWAADVPVGTYVQTTECSMLTPGEKSKYLGKIDALITAVKMARQKANCAEVPAYSGAGAAIFNYIHESD
jgi:hypothetical protein